MSPETPSSPTLGLVNRKSAAVASGRGRTGRDVLARTISYTLNPLLLFAGCFFLPWLIDHSRLSIIYGLVHLGSLGLLFAFYWGLLKVMGHRLDFELNQRADRVMPLSITVTALIVLGAVLWFTTGSSLHVYTNVAGACMFLAFLAITSYWKVSLHSLTMSFVLAAAFLVIGLDWKYWPLLGLVPVVVWARMHLGYHDLGQSLVGIVLGVSTILLFQWLLAADPLGLLA